VSLTGIWQELGSEPAATGLALRRLSPESDFDIFACLDLATRVPSLSLRRDWQPGATIPPFPNTQGLRCRTELHDGGRQLRVNVELIDLTLTEAFTPLVEDLASRISTASSEDEAVSRLADGLGEWQQLLETLAAHGMGTLVRRGLAGELLILADVLMPIRGPAAVEAWTGPLKANQDFQFPNIAIEVKVTTGKQPQAFRVANERELDDEHTGQLLLAHLSIDERRGGEGRTLNDLVESVDAALQGWPLARETLRDRLARVGYLARDVERYLEPRYSLRALRWFAISQGFPRLLESDLPDGVGDVAYSVTLAACLPFEVDAHIVNAHLEPAS